VPDEVALPFRLLRRGLRAATRAGASAVDRVLTRGEPEPFEGAVPRDRTRKPTSSPGSCLVRFGGLEVRVASGATILDAAAAAGVDLRSYCGGNCSCGTCRVEIPERSRRALSRRTGNEEMVLGMDAAARGDRLATERSPANFHTLLPSSYYYY